MPSDTWDVLMIKFIFVVKHFSQLIIKLGFILSQGLLGLFGLVM